MDKINKKVLNYCKRRIKPAKIRANNTKDKTVIKLVKAYKNIKNYIENNEDLFPEFKSFYAYLYNKFI